MFSFLKYLLLLGRIQRQEILKNGDSEEVQFNLSEIRIIFRKEFFVELKLFEGQSGDLIYNIYLNRSAIN